LICPSQFVYIRTDSICFYHQDLSGVFMSAFVEEIQSQYAPGIRIRRFATMRAGWLITLLLCVTPSLWATITTEFRGVTTTLNLGSVSLSTPEGILVDAAGTVYVSDTVNNRIIQISAAGVTSVMSISGVTINLPTGLAKDPAGVLYVADSGNNRVVKVDTSGTGTVVSTPSITLNSPQGVAVDPSGNIYIADSGNSQIVKVTSSGTASVFALTGLGTPLNIPFGLVTDPAGNLYIADSSNNRIVKSTPAGAASVMPVTGGVTLNNPTGVSFDIEGTLQVADSNNNRIVFLGPNSANANVYLLSTSLNDPIAVGVDVYGKIYIADTVDNSVVTFAPNNVDFGHVQVGASSGNTINLPFAVSVSNTLTGVNAYTTGTNALDFTVVSGGTTCVVSTVNTNCNVVVQFLPTAAGLRQGAVVLSYSGGNLTVPVSGMSDGPVATVAPGVATIFPLGSSTLSNPFQSALDGAGNLYVANYSSTVHDVIKFPAGGGTGTVVSTGGITLSEVTGVAIDGFGNIYIADYGGNKIVEVPVGGTPFVLLTGSPLSEPTGIYLDASNNLYISNYGAGHILKLTPSGVLTTLSTGSYTFSASAISGVAVDRFGNVYISDSNNARVVTITVSGAASVVATPGVTLTSPHSVAVDGMGNLYILDTHVVEVTTAGVASVLSTGTFTASVPYGFTVDPSGNVYLSDFGNNRIINLNLSAGKLAYVTAAIGVASSDSPKAATVTNIGDQALVFTAVSTYPTDFPVNSSDTNLCAAATSLLPGTVCDVAASFIPQSPGALTGTVTTTNNTLNAVGSTQQVSFSGTGFRVDTTATAVTATPAAITIGSPINISALVTDSTVPATIPTGQVSFTDLVGSTGISLNGGTAVNLNGAGTAALVGVTLVGAGTHTITANYAGVTNSFLSSTNSATVTVNKATTSITGPSTQPVLVTHGQAGSLPVSLSGTAGLAVPSGTLAYTITDSTNATVASSTATVVAGSSASTATIPIANSLSSGLYTVSFTYSGDTYYAVPPAVSVQIQVGQLNPVVSFTAAPSPITYGTALGSILAATATYNSGSVSGTFTYTATPTGGTATAVTVASVLGGGTYALTALFTPTDTTLYTAASGEVSLTVNKVTPILTLASSSSNPSAQTTIHLTASVSSISGAPTSTVNFFDGTNPTPLGTGTVTAGVATLALSTLSVGTHSITAVYAGDTNFLTVTSVAVQVQVKQGVPIVSFAATPSPVTYGTVLGSILSATASYSSSALTGTYTYTATPTGGTATVVAAATILNAGTYTLTALFTPTDTTDFTTASVQVQLSVNKSTPGIALTSSNATPFAQNAITFTVAVTSTPTVATGTVSFYDGTNSTPLGTSTLAGAVATFTISTLAAGSHSITAIYSGDTNFAALTSSAVTETIQDFSLNISTAPGGTTSATVQPGGTATYLLSISPTGASTFAAAVVLTASGLPTGATYTLTPSTLAAGSGTANVTLTITVPQLTAAARPNSSPGGGVASVTLALLLLPFSRRMRKTARKLGRTVPMALLLLAGAAVMVGLTGCGVSTGFFGQQQQTYNVVVTGTSGALTHSTTVTLTVQ
jgi:sugar lactone lactonase YvrE